MSLENPKGKMLDLKSSNIKVYVKFINKAKIKKFFFAVVSQLKKKGLLRNLHLLSITGLAEVT